MYSSYHYAGWCYVSLTSTSPDININKVTALILSYELLTWLIIIAIMSCVIGYIMLYCYKKKNVYACGCCSKQAVANNVS